MDLLNINNHSKAQDVLTSVDVFYINIIPGFKKSVELVTI